MAWDHSVRLVRNERHCDVNAVDYESELVNEQCRSLVCFSYV